MQTAYRSTNYLHTYVHKEVRRLSDLEKLFLICDKLLQSYKGGCFIPFTNHHNTSPLNKCATFPAYST